MILSGGYGFADREKNIQNTSQTRFPICSLTKQFTAMAILMLQEQGKLNVQDGICGYLTECPEPWEPITIHQLLTHTSGIPDLLEEFWTRDVTSPVPLEQLIADAKSRPVLSPPGKEFSYNNTGYILLGRIIESASGQTYGRFLKENIFQPLKMLNTGFDPNPTDLAIGYKEKEQIPRPDLNKRKAYLANWYGPIIDKGNAATLHIGYLDASTKEGFYDYWTTKAVLKSMPKLHQQLTEGTLRLREVARRIDLVVVVVTSDNKLVLARRSENVDNAQGHWMASIGESLDPSTDLDKNGVPNPFIATRRCLEEYDELNLSTADIGDAQLTALGIATEWQFLYANLVVLVQLEIEFGRVKERVTDGEHTHVEGIDFTPRNCLPIIKHGRYEASSPLLSAPVVPASRVALLMSLMSRFGYDEVVSLIG